MKAERTSLAPASIDFKSAIAILLMGMVAVFAGLVASTAEAILIVLMVGIFGGVALLMAPGVSIWLLLALGLFSGFFVSLFPGLSMLPWALSLLSMLLLIPATLKFMEGKNIPGFIWIALVFMIYAMLITFIQWYSTGEFLGGFKRFFQMYGLMFAMALLTFKPQDYRRWLTLMLFIALAQFPFSLYEHFVLAAMRSGRGVSGAEATDVVAGTLGANIEGGSPNAEMAAFLIIAMAFILARWKEGLLNRFKLACLSSLCLLPLGLGETKIVILLLPLIWLIVMREDLKRKLGRFAIQFIGLLLATFILGMIYFGLNKGSAGDVLNQTISYNFGTRGYGQYTLNRTTVLSFWWAHQDWNDPMGMLIGHGLGSSYSNPSNSVPGHIGMQYIGFGVDQTSASTLLWDTGALGLLIFSSIFVTAWLSAGRLHKMTSDPHVRADALALQACITVFLSFLFYDNALVNFLPFEVMTAAVLGYLGYLVNKQNSDSVSRVAVSP